MALALMNRDRSNRQEIRYYWHPECKAYHLTKTAYRWWENGGQRD